MSEIAVECSPVDSGWLACVTVTDHGSSREFEVGLSDAELAHFDPGAADPMQLVRRSFGLSIIVRYFPEYEREIRRS